MTVLLTACSTLEFPGVYRLAIEQGNIITGEMVAQLKPGLSKSQVEFILGKALIQDPFSPQRWDYVYNLTNADKSVDRKYLTAYFDDSGRLSRFDTNVEPVTAEDKAAQEKQKAEAAEPELRNPTPKKKPARPE